MGDGVDGERVAGAALVHQQAHLVFSGGGEAGRQHLAIGIPDFEAGVIEHGGAGGVAELDAEGITGDLRAQAAADAEQEVERGGWRIEGGALFHGEAVLETARVVDKPLLDIGIPLVGEALAVRLHGRGAADGGGVFGEAVALQLEAPLPAAVLGRGEEAAFVKLGGPLLARIARLPAGRGGLESMAPGLVGGADARPVGLGQALGHLVRAGERLGLARLGGGPGRQCGHEQRRERRDGEELVEEFHGDWVWLG